MDSLQKRLALFLENLDDFPVGAANVHDSISLESEINTVQSNLQSTNAEILHLRTLTHVVKNYEGNKGRPDDAHITKYETALVDDASVINHPRNMAAIPDEAAALREALAMHPQELEHLSSSCRSLVERIKNIVPKCSSTQLELLDIQNDISQKMREVLVLECTLMEKKAKFGDDLVKQKKQLSNKKSSKDGGYERKSKELKIMASRINKLKAVIQALLILSPEDLENKKSLNDIIVSTRQPLNLATYSTQL